MSRTYCPIDSLNDLKLFWSNFKMVKRFRFEMVSGSRSSLFCDKCKSVKFTKLPNSYGNSSMPPRHLLLSSSRLWKNCNRQLNACARAQETTHETNLSLLSFKNHQPWWQHYRSFYANHTHAVMQLQMTNKLSSDNVFCHFVLSFRVCLCFQMTSSIRLSSTYMLFVTSRHVKFVNRPISAGNRRNKLLSNQSSWSDAKLPMHDGKTSKSLSPKSRRSNFVKFRNESGNAVKLFSRNSSDWSELKLKMWENKVENV